MEGCPSGGTGLTLEDCSSVPAPGPGPAAGSSGGQGQGPQEAPGRGPNCLCTETVVPAHPDLLGSPFPIPISVSEYFFFFLILYDLTNNNSSYHKKVKERMLLSSGRMGHSQVHSRGGPVGLRVTRRGLLRVTSYSNVAWRVILQRHPLTSSSNPPQN